MSEDRLKYLIMRCVACKGFLTKLEIIGAWEELEGDHTSKCGICPCGGRQLKPGNLTEEEEEIYTSKWQWLRYRVLGKRDRLTRVWDLYYRCVKGKELGEKYGLHNQ